VPTTVARTSCGCASDFHLPGFGDHMIVREYVAFFIDNETGALTLLRHQAIKKSKVTRAR